MSLENFYSLRNNFLVLGLTGRTGGGCKEIGELLKGPSNPFLTDVLPIPNNLHVNEIQKFNICQNILTDPSNKWKRFSIIQYRDVLLLFFISWIYEEVNGDFNRLTDKKLIGAFNKIYDRNSVKTRRIGQEDGRDGMVSKEIFPFLMSNASLLNQVSNLFKISGSRIVFKSEEGQIEDDRAKYLNAFFFNTYSRFASNLFHLIDKKHPLARQLLLQDIASNLRKSGHVYFAIGQRDSAKGNFVFTVAEAIKRIIKINIRANSKIRNNKTRIVIDSLKNSLEINYFRERYAGFYLLASNRDEDEIENYLDKKIEKLGFKCEERRVIREKIKGIDNKHYKISDFKEGKFTAPDIENCIQKADYYIYLDKEPTSEPRLYEPGDYRYLNLKLQMLKFLALIYKPGIVTPSAIERSMQLAFSSKYNSGCISRQVGAVVTDENYSVKSVGWNEVPQGQTPCTLRNLKELVNGDKTSVYSEYERNGGDYNGKTFKEKVNETLKSTYGKESQYFNNLNGHNCPYCFKDFHNAFEGKDNQVHTRSLHAEENAMLQISKFGGQALKGGILFTTASPCELCSKKAFQLGIVKIFYIDPYPGISRQQILKAGNDPKKNPELYMFQGAVGRGYFKLYEPYMSIKDETYIRTGIKAKTQVAEALGKMKNGLMMKFAANKKLKKQIERVTSYDELANILVKEL